jgi:diadenosine tetraphosphatase ApaH/serine/threonine PP2A family protein phosphatase
MNGSSSARRDSYAILGDIHGNLEALDAVLEDAKEQGVDAYVSVGDIVGYNASPAECLERVRDLACGIVRGNHDHYCSHDESLHDFHPLAASVVDWTRRALTAEQIAFLGELRLIRMVADFTLVHSTLDMPDKWGYVFDGLEADANFNYQTTALCFHGHTHVPVVYTKFGRVERLAFGKTRMVMGTKYFINVGSVGQPRDGDPRAAYAIYDARNREVVLRRLPYDIAKAQQKIRDAGLPERLARRLEVGH